MDVGVIGCGLLGAKRAKALGNHRLLKCADIVLQQAEDLAKLHDGAIAFADWRFVVEDKDIDIVLVSTTPDKLAEVTLAAAEAGKHVLVEKPAGTSAGQISEIAHKIQELNVKVCVGFNHRFHPAVQMAARLIRAGEIGELMFIRACYGHGGRLGYESEWRANAAIAGGGELIDQGFHLIDLSRWYFNEEFVEVNGYLDTYFWNMPVEDNAFMFLKTANSKAAWLHASWTEWKNGFNLEIFGQMGKIQIDGLGGSYGLEQITLYRMSPQMGPPEATNWQYPGPDDSFCSEFSSFVNDIESGTASTGDLADAIAAWQIAEAMYSQSKFGKSKIRQNKIG